jgi:exodeoxyribonuclease VII small subunit
MRETRKSSLGWRNKCPLYLWGRARRVRVTRPKIAILIPGVLRFMVTASKHGPAAPAHYEAALQELEQLVSRLESGDMPLEQLLTQYQRGAELLKFCRDRLAGVEDQIKVLDQGTLKTWAGESA